MYQPNLAYSYNKAYDSEWLKTTSLRATDRELLRACITGQASRSQHIYSPVHCAGLAWHLLSACQHVSTPNKKSKSQMLRGLSRIAFSGQFN